MGISGLLTLWRNCGVVQAHNEVKRITHNKFCVDCPLLKLFNFHGTSISYCTMIKELDNYAEEVQGVS